MGYKVGAECFEEGKEALVEMYARQIFYEKFDISGTDKMGDAYKIVVRALDGLQARKRMRLLEVPDGLYPMVMFSSHFLSKMFMNPSILETLISFF